MADWALPYSLIAATVVGTAIAVLIGRYLDRGISKRNGVIGIHIPKTAEIIDFTQKNILLVPRGKSEPIERLFEQEILIGNIGFDTVSDFQIKLCRAHSKPFDEEIDFISHSISLNPEGLEFEIFDGEKLPIYDESILKFDFMNRGDSFRLKILSSSEMNITFLAHHRDTIFKEVQDIKLLPTLRQKIGNVVGSGRIIESLTLVTMAAAVAAGSGVLEKFFGKSH